MKRSRFVEERFDLMSFFCAGRFERTDPDWAASSSGPDQVRDSGSVGHTERIRWALNIETSGKKPSGQYSATDKLFALRPGTLDPDSLGRTQRHGVISRSPFRVCSMISY